MFSRFFIGENEGGFLAMILYKNTVLFAVPKKFSHRDIEFNIYDIQGNLIGTNFEGIRRDLMLSEQERYELEEFIQDMTLELEVKMKFFKEYGVEISNWKSLSLSKEDILECMDIKWNISEKALLKLL